MTPISHRCVITMPDGSTRRYDAMEARTAYWAAYYARRFWRVAAGCIVSVYDPIGSTQLGRWSVDSVGRLTRLPD